MTSKNPLVGTWKLISCENHAPDGTITYPPPTSYAGIVQVGHVLWQKISQ